MNACISYYWSYARLFRCLVDLSRVLIDSIFPLFLICLFFLGALFGWAYFKFPSLILLEAWIFVDGFVIHYFETHRRNSNWLFLIGIHINREWILNFIVLLLQKFYKLGIFFGIERDDNSFFCLVFLHAFYYVVVILIDL